mgnify:FL=1
MRSPRVPFAVLAALVVGLAGCKGSKKVEPPFTPKATPTPAVVPNNPAPAPTPRNVTPVPQEDIYTQLLRMPIDEIERMGILGDIYFDFDQSDLREADKATLVKNAEALKKFDFLVVAIEGHSDERGTVEYNLALSDRRARVVYDYLVSVGIPASRMKSVAYGKEIPVCTESTEDCWQRNRRAHFAVTGKTR